jgi:DDE superfamily endonuclease
MELLIKEWILEQRAIDEKGATSVPCRDSGSDSKRCTVIVTVAADGTKLPLFYVFKGTPGGRIEKAFEHDGINACCQEKAWFDSVTVAEKWIKCILEPYLAGTERSFLLVDHFKCHLTKLFTNKIADLGCDIDYIPAGYTCVLQPVDVGVNAPLKKGIRDLHHEWCLEKYQGVGNDDRLPIPSREELMLWVQKSYDLIKPISIKKTFRHIGLIRKDNEEDLEENDNNNDEIEENDNNDHAIEADYIIEDEGLHLVPPTMV